MYPENFDDLVIDSRAEFEALSEEVKVAWLVHRLEAEVNNGGFHQFFLNSSGAYVPETIDALSAIGADRTKVLLQRAVQACFPGGIPTTAKSTKTSLPISTISMAKWSHLMRHSLNMLTLLQISPIVISLGVSSA